MGGDYMSFSKVACCNHLHNGRVFNIPPTNKMRRALIFLDECPICGQAKAVIKNVEFNGSVNIAVSRTGSKALDLLNRYNLVQAGLHKIEKGSKNNMNWNWFDGLKDFWVRDLNNKKIFKLFG